MPGTSSDQRVPEVPVGTRVKLKSLRGGPDVGYSVVSRLARGGFGSVYVGRDASGQEVALKFMHAGGHEAERPFFERLMKEHERQVALCDNGVRVIPPLATGTVPTADGRTAYVLAMKLLTHARALGEGRSFGERVHDLKLALKAVQQLHNNRAVHRDLKPSNLLFADGDVWIADLGLASGPQDPGVDTRRAVLRGSFSPGYTPPEQRSPDSESDLGPYVDVYAMGCVAHFVLTCKAPGNPTALELQVMEDRVRRFSRSARERFDPPQLRLPQELFPHDAFDRVCSGLWESINAALELDYEQRTSDISALLRSVEAVERALLPKAYQSTLLAKVGPGTGRRASPSAISGVGIHAPLVQEVRDEGFGPVGLDHPEFDDVSLGLDEDFDFGANEGEEHQDDEEDLGQEEMFNPTYLTTVNDRPPAESPGVDPYRWQSEALRSWRSAERKGIIEAVTGSGKSHVGVEAIREQLRLGGKAVVVVPTRVLVTQWTRLLGRLEPSIRCGQVRAGMADQLNVHDVVVSTIHSLHLLRVPAGTLLIADECHRYGGVETRDGHRSLGAWAKQLSTARWGPRMGLSATVERGDGGHEDALMRSIGPVVYTLDLSRAIVEQVIAPFKIVFLLCDFADSEREQYERLTGQLKKLGSELRGLAGPSHGFAAFFEAVEAAAKGDGPSTGAARRWLKAFNERRALLADGHSKVAMFSRIVPAIREAERTLVFTNTAKAADAVCSTLAAEGVPCALVDQRDGVNRGAGVEGRSTKIRKFSSGQYSVIVSPKVLDEGFDVPHADLGISLAASRSKRQMIQRLGRVVRRKADGRTARFLLLVYADTVEDPRQRVHDEGGFLESVFKAIPKERFEGAVRLVSSPEKAVEHLSVGSSIGRPSAAYAGVQAGRVSEGHERGGALGGVEMRPKPIVHSVDRGLGPIEILHNHLTEVLSERDLRAMAKDAGYPWWRSPLPEFYHELMENNCEAIPEFLRRTSASQRQLLFERVSPLGWLWLGDGEIGVAQLYLGALENEESEAGVTIAEVLSRLPIARLKSLAEAVSLRLRSQLTKEEIVKSIVESGIVFGVFAAMSPEDLKTLLVSSGGVVNSTASHDLIVDLVEHIFTR